MSVIDTAGPIDRLDLKGFSFGAHIASFIRIRINGLTPAMQRMPIANASCRAPFRPFPVQEQQGSVIARRHRALNICDMENTLLARMPTLQSGSPGQFLDIRVGARVMVTAVSAAPAC
ncbi:MULTISPECIES: hypothetical protein [Mesorhizobium]|uniref:hypothetical protein n=1 Tax=Mesorhizobium TaxID=68287 RepID=UPI0007EC384B|nr:MULTISPECIES: hypothetical protein [Mesorhizobium]PBB52007.1 hypothetical protein CK223_31800 [Mesorhizobium loti]QIA25567.1 hypothetical protein A9K68_030670 [Mesorhizobium sp. AA22]